jgi:hypothetical protein
MEIWYMSITLSLSLSLSLILPTDLVVGGSSTGQPPVDLRFVAGYRQKDESEAATSSG